MARIIAGSAKGRVLKVPVRGTRPTSDRVREAVMSLLDNRGYLTDCDIADLYAGTGAFALEALSRGARSAHCVEAASQAVRIIRQNAQVCGLTVDVTQSKVETWLATVSGHVFDIAFLDPPYDVDEDSLARVLALLPAHMKEDGLILVERSKHSPEPAWSQGWSGEKPRTWGDTRLWIAFRDGSGEK